MSLTDYQAKYFAYELTKRSPSDSMEKLAGAVASAQVDLNPHQVDAALFAFRSPLSKGALLADEVGLGKTIEAGLVLSQRWAERKRRILIVVPSNLRKQSLASPRLHCISLAPARLDRYPSRLHRPCRSSQSLHSLAASLAVLP
jgi:hypothetical protein